MRPLLGVLVVGAAWACSVGPRVENIAPAHDPAGATIQLHLRKGRPRQVVQGELLSVQDSGLLVHDPVRMVFVANGAVKSGTLLVQGVGASFGGKAVGATRERLRLLSRYPGGVSAELLRNLLAAYGSDSVETIR